MDDVKVHRNSDKPATSPRYAEVVRSFRAGQENI